MMDIRDIDIDGVSIEQELWGLELRNSGVRP